MTLRELSKLHFGTLCVDLVVPGVASPAWWARANTLRYDHYSEGIVYSQYDNGDPIREIPEESKGKMILRQKRGGWKLQSEMEHE